MRFKPCPKLSAPRWTRYRLNSSYIIPFFPLVSLIAARGVSTRWRHFAQVASLHRARRTLLDVYLAAIHHLNFRSLRAVLHPHVRKFDREAYLDSLTSRGCVLPDLFELWVLEWPSNAVCFWAWPGLPCNLDMSHRNLYRGVNGLSVCLQSMPIVRSLQVRTTPGQPNRSCKVLLLWGTRNHLGLVLLWLIVDENNTFSDAERGKLVWTSGQGWSNVAPDQSECGACRAAEGQRRCFGLSSFYDFITMLDMTRFDLVWMIEMFRE